MSIHIRSSILFEVQQHFIAPKQADCKIQIAAMWKSQRLKMQQLNYIKHLIIIAIAYSG